MILNLFNFFSSPKSLQNFSPKTSHTFYSIFIYARILLSIDNITILSNQVMRLVSFVCSFFVHLR